MMHLTIQQAQPVAVVTSVKQKQAQREQNSIKTEQMYRNYMQTGSIYYDVSGKEHPESKVIEVTKKPISLDDIQKDAKEWVKKQE